MGNTRKSQTFEYGRRYEFKNGLVHDDEYPEYRFLEPTEYADGCYVSDCWVVNAAGEVCPGYNVSPVPIHISRVRLVPSTK